MGEIIAFTNAHPLHAMIIVALLIAVLVYEIRLKGRGIAQVTSGMAVQLINRGATVLDVRPAESYSEGHIANSKNIPLAEITKDAGVVKKKKDKVLVTVCDNGMVSRRAADLLRKSGYEAAYSLQGGLTAWRGDNLPLVK
jgi:rhodanese-related sulfurtransferase